MEPFAPCQASIFQEKYKIQNPEYRAGLLADENDFETILSLFMKQIKVEKGPQTVVSSMKTL